MKLYMKARHCREARGGKDDWVVRRAEATPQGQSFRFSGVASSSLVKSQPHGPRTRLPPKRDHAADMPSLLVTVFALEVVIQIINSVGAAAINNLVCRSVALPSPA